jgi:hypothetical protein
VREDPLWARIALLLNLVGTALLFLSFQATSSDFRLVTAKSKEFPDDTQYALCVNKTALMQTSQNGAFTIGSSACPNWEHARPAAVVNVEHPFFVVLGFSFTILGFFIQLFTVPRRKTLAEVNEEMRILRKQKKQLESEIPT